MQTNKIQNAKSTKNYNLHLLLAIKFNYEKYFQQTII